MKHLWHKTIAWCGPLCQFWGIRFKHRMMEWYLALAMTFAGWALLMESEIFEASPYAFVRDIASEPLWGQALLGIGGLRIIALGFNGILPHGTPHIRALLSIASLLIWSQLCVGYLVSSVPTLMPAFLAPAVVFEIVNAYRAARDAGAEDMGGGSDGMA